MALSPSVIATKKSKKNENTPPPITPIVRHQLPTPLSISQSQDKALAERLTIELNNEDDRLEWLNGKDADLFLALVRSPPEMPAKGTVLIIPSLAYHADWPGLVRILRQTLTQEDLFTVSISTPNYTPAVDPMLTKRSPIAAKTDESSGKSKKDNKKKKKDKKDKKKAGDKKTDPQSTSAANNSTPKPMLDPLVEWEGFMQARLKAALDLADGLQSGKKVLVASDKTAPLLLNMLKKNNQMMDAYIFINPPRSIRKEPAFKVLLDNNAPILEISTDLQRSDAASNIRTGKKKPSSTYVSNR